VGSLRPLVRMPPTEERLRSAVEMPGGGRRWETLVSQLWEFTLDIEFPTVAHRPWKSPTARFPHSHSAAAMFSLSLSLCKSKWLAPFGRSLV
jgi:hypothetical protein